MPGTKKSRLSRFGIVPGAHPGVDPAVVDPLGDELPQELLVQFLEDLDV